MNPTPTPNGAMLLFRGTEWYKGMSPDEMQKVADVWMEWFHGLTASGKAVAGQPLEREGKIVSGPGGRSVSDGAFIESKEAIGGYFLLRVADLEEAVEIARGCPGLAYGIEVEVRPVAGECALYAESAALVAHA